MSASIIISSYNRLALLRRALWGIATRPPSGEFEVVLVDEMSTDDVLKELRYYSASFRWKFVRVDPKKFEEKTGLAKFHNSPCLTNNVGFKHAGPNSERIFLQGNEVIPWENVYDRLVGDSPGCDNYLVMSTTLDVPAQYLELLDPYGANLTARIVKECERWPLQSKYYRSDVTNYISLCSRKLWETVGGYDERYFAGISAEDSDFVRRARKAPGFQQVVSDGLSLHQSHGGKTCYYEPKAEVISKEKWDEGVAKNHALWNLPCETFRNQQPWPWGEYGVVDVVSNT